MLAELRLQSVLLGDLVRRQLDALLRLARHSILDLHVLLGVETLLLPNWSRVIYLHVPIWCAARTLLFMFSRIDLLSGLQYDLSTLIAVNVFGCL